MNRAEFLGNFISGGKTFFTSFQLNILNFAYDLAKEAHRPQKRDSGERYFDHPRAVALILWNEASFKDLPTVVAALLHDVAEDTPLLGSPSTGHDIFENKKTYKIWKEEIAFRINLIFKKKYFDNNGSIAKIVVALSKPPLSLSDIITKGIQEEFYFVGLHQAHPKTLLVKMADRLHNLRSLPLEQKEKIEKQIKETENKYYPLFQKACQAKDKDIARSANILFGKIQKEIERLKNL